MCEREKEGKEGREREREGKSANFKSSTHRSENFIKTSKLVLRKCHSEIQTIKSICCLVRRDTVYFQKQRSCLYRKVRHLNNEE